jgi:hypothetical protein
LVAVRIMARTTGLSSHPWELVGLVGFVGYLAASPSGWPAAIILVGTLWIDGGHVHQPHPPARIAAVAAAVVAIVVVVIAFPTTFYAGRGWAGNAAFLIGAGATWPAVSRLEHPVSLGDHDRAPLSSLRLVQARIAAGLGIALGGALTTLHPAAYGPLWGAVVGVAVVALLRRSRQRPPSRTASAG